ncbi:MAG: JAB domain-containing protein, partial [Bacteroidota bacterium]
MNIKLTASSKIKIKSSDDIYPIMQKILMRENKVDRDREHFWTISLNNAHKILNIELVSMGTINKTFAEPMEVFSIPLQKRAVKIILVHNHPSGELKPSDADKDLTDKLIQVSRIMNVPVLDHLIIAEKSYMSFKDIGLLEELERSTKYVPAYEMRRRYEQAVEEKGTEKGKKERSKEMARAMKGKNYPIEEIVELTGLPKSTINRI